MKSAEQEIREGREAQAFYEHPQFSAAFNGVENGLISAMKASKVADTVTHHELVLSLQLLGQLRRHFVTMIETGRMAAIQEEANGRKRRA